MHTNPICTTALPPDQVKANSDGADTQDQGIQSWTTFLKAVIVQEQQKILANLTTSDRCFNTNDLNRGKRVGY